MTEMVIVERASSSMVFWQGGTQGGGEEAESPSLLTLSLVFRHSFKTIWQDSVIFHMLFSVSFAA